MPSNRSGPARRSTGSSECSSRPRAGRRPDRAFRSVATPASSRAGRKSLTSASRLAPDRPRRISADVGLDQIARDRTARQPGASSKVAISFVERPSPEREARCGSSRPIRSDCCLPVREDTNRGRQHVDDGPVVATFLGAGEGVYPSSGRNAITRRALVSAAAGRPSPRRRESR